MARRICTIVEKSDLKMSKLKELKTVLKKQKYPLKVIEKGIEKACAIPMEVLRSEKQPKKEKIVPFILTFNPNNTNIYPVIRNTFQNLRESTELISIFKDYKLIKSLTATKFGENFVRIEIFRGKTKLHSQ